MTFSAVFGDLPLDSMDATKFFKPWEAPPHYVPAPADSALTQRIQKLAQFASRNGPSFVELISNKQAGNPEYAFLSGGEGSTYFRWILYCNLHSLNPGWFQARSGAPLSDEALPCELNTRLGSNQACLSPRWLTVSPAQCDSCRAARRCSYAKQQPAPCSSNSSRASTGRICSA